MNQTFLTFIFFWNEKKSCKCELPPWQNYKAHSNTKTINAKSGKKANEKTQFWSLEIELLCTRWDLKEVPSFKCHPWCPVILTVTWAYESGSAVEHGGQETFSVGGTYSRLLGLGGISWPSLIPLRWVLGRWKLDTEVYASSSFQWNYQEKTWRLKLKFVAEIASWSPKSFKIFLGRWYGDSLKS